MNHGRLTLLHHPAETLVSAGESRLWKVLAPPKLADYFKDILDFWYQITNELTNLFVDSKCGYPDRPAVGWDYT